MKQSLKTALTIILVIGAVFILITLLKKPAQDRNWTDDAEVLPDITISDSKVKVDNLRDWRYKNKETISRDFYNEEFDLDLIENTYFLLNPFGKWEGVGHTFFLFEFSDGKTVSVSVEARREVDEKFSAIRGLFNNFEQWYTWGSAADLFSRRAIFHQEDLYMYKLNIKPETSRGLFIDIAKTTEKLETEPAFYNTAFSNCTNVLADSANRVYSGSIPWNWARVFTGFSDDKLYELKLIPHDKPFDEIFQEARIDLQIKEIIEKEEKLYRDDFWYELRSLI